ncbi:MAG TPA: hypothetical protein VFL97_06570 [Nitrococcus sp.]|nr:hypothetical protein [Nitrococcus sp.]
MTLLVASAFIAITAAPSIYLIKKIAREDEVEKAEQRRRELLDEE